jgi:hypothetical protein
MIRCLRIDDVMSGDRWFNLLNFFSIRYHHLYAFSNVHQRCLVVDRNWYWVLGTLLVPDVVLLSHAVFQEVKSFPLSYGFRY